MLPMVLHHPRAAFDEINLLKLLRGSYSLSLDEKLQLLRKISAMSQGQIDGLTRLLVSEHEKFEFIVDEFPEDVSELVEQRVHEMNLAVEYRKLQNN